MYSEQVSVNGRLCHVVHQAKNIELLRGFVLEKKINNKQTFTNNIWQYYYHMLLSLLSFGDKQDPSFHDLSIKKDFSKIGVQPLLMFPDNIFL